MWLTMKRLVNLSLVCKKNAMTLIEILVAISLISLISILSVQTTIQGFNINNKILKNTDYYHLIRTTFRHFENDVLLAFHSYLDTEYGAYLRQTMNKDEEYKESSFFIGEKDKLSFSTSSHLRVYRDSKETSVVEVSYYLATDPDDARISNLYKRESVYVDDKFLEGGSSYVLIKDVDSIEFKYLDKKNLDVEPRWTDRWSSIEGETINKFPIGVEMIVKIKHNVLKNEFLTFNKIVKLLNPNNVSSNQNTGSIF